jgi:hypothetical protein
VTTTGDPPATARHGLRVGPARGPAWFFEPAPAGRLAVFRILVGGYVAVWSLARLPAHVGHARQPAGRWQPVGVLAPLDGPLPDWLVVTTAVATPVLAIAVALGWRYRATAPLLAASVLVVTTLDSSWGQVFHTENLVALHVIVLAAAPAAADALAVGRRGPASAPAPTPDGRYGWPTRLAGVVVVITYVVAGVAKLRASGLGWAGGDVLRNLVAHDNLRKSVLGDMHSPLGAELVGHGWLFPPLALVTLLVELGAPAAMLGRRPRLIWTLAAWMFHVGILALMAIVFPYQLSGVAFAPFFALERLPGRLRAARRTRRDRPPRR